MAHALLSVNMLVSQHVLFLKLAVLAIIYGIFKVLGQLEFIDPILYFMTALPSPRVVAILLPLKLQINVVGMRLNPHRVFSYGVNICLVDLAVDPHPFGYHAFLWALDNVVFLGCLQAVKAVRVCVRDVK